jgi:quinoprotein glucose dehydrogenase
MRAIYVTREVSGAVLIGLAIFALCLGERALSQEVGINRGIFSLQQAVAGEALYRRDCASCHGPDLDGGEIGFPLAGRSFRAKWLGRPLSELAELQQRTMPLVSPGSLGARQYSELLAYILLRNNYPTGELLLPAEGQALAGITIVEPAAGVDGEAILAASLPSGEPVGPTVEWLHHRGDSGSTNYSPLDIINRDNVGDLEIAWRWKSDNFGAVQHFNLQTTPIMANGVLYATAGFRRVVVAIDAATGETLWIYRMDEGQRGENAPRKGAGRGVAYWNDGGLERIYSITPGYQLVALDAASGNPIEEFGNYGVVDLKLGLDQKVDLINDPIGASSPPIVVNGVVIVGSAFPGGRAPAKKSMVTGHVRGFDARTGERLWIFHTIPHPGEFGHDTWEDEGWKLTGNTGAWTPMSADPELGYVYLPLEAPTHDFYGGHRPGDNLFSQSLVCLDAATGERVWHYQTVHHGIWDYDLPAPPVLLDIAVDGKEIPAVAQVTKQGFTFVFDRRNGEPVWPIEERAVPKSDVPGEHTSATQPHPTLPVPFDRQGVTENDLNNLTGEIFEEAKRIASEYRMGPLFSPPALYTEEIKGQLVSPTPFGGANWQGAVGDPDTGIIYVSSTTGISALSLVHDPEQSEMDYIGGPGTRIQGPFGLPLARPPWGRITAIDLKTGQHVWMMANADTPDEILAHEKLQGIDIPRTGHNERVGMLVTASLFFAGEGAGLYVATGSGNLLRAHDKQTGEILAAIELPANQSGMPMTYAVNGKQYIVVAVGAQGHAGELVALTLPDVDNSDSEKRGGD